MEIVAYFITAIATLALAVYAGFQIWLMRCQVELIGREISESKKSRDATLVLYLLKHMHSFRGEWHDLYMLPEDHRSWTDGQRKLADSVGVKLQEAAFLGLSGLFEREYLIDNFAGTFVKCWLKLEDFIRDYRGECNEPRTIEEGAFQRKHLEIFAHECAKYLKQHHSKIYDELMVIYNQRLSALEKTRFRLKKEVGSSIRCKGIVRWQRKK